MIPGLSSFVFFPERLNRYLLEALRRAGAQAIEIPAARHHFDYTDRPAVRELAAWFRDSGLLATLDQPRFADAEWSRHVAPTLNLLDPDKSRRILAMDETKRALEAAEHIPFRALTLYLGDKGDPWSPRALEFSLTAIEHLKAFATPLGVQILLENIDNEITTPEHLLEVLRIGHFDTVGITLDLGHVNLDTVRERSTLRDGQPRSDRRTPPDPQQSQQPRGLGDRRRAPADSWTTPPRPSHSTAEPGTPEHALDLLAPRLVQLHLHDNDRTRDAHLAPGTLTPGTAAKAGLDWPALAPRLAALPNTVLGIIELTADPAATPETITTRAQAAFDLLHRLTDQARESASIESL